MEGIKPDEILSYNDVDNQITKIINETDDKNLSSLTDLNSSILAYAKSTDAAKMSVEDFYSTQVKSTTGILGAIQAIKTYNNISEEDTATRKAYAQAVGNVNASLGKQMTNLNGANATAGTYAKSLVNVTAKTLAMNTATMAANLAINALASIAVQAIITGISKLAHQYEDYQEKLDETINEAHEAATAYREEQDSVDSLLGRYTEIVTSYSDITEAKEELLSIQDELKNKYDDEVEGLDLLNKSYAENIELIRQAKKEAAEETIEKNKSKYDQAEKYLSESAQVWYQANDYGQGSYKGKGNYTKLKSSGWGNWFSDSEAEEIIQRYNNVYVSKQNRETDKNSLFVSGTAEEQLETLTQLYGELSDLWADKDSDSNEIEWLNEISDRIDTLDEQIEKSKNTVEEYKNALSILNSSDSSIPSFMLNEAIDLKNKLTEAETSADKVAAASALSELQEKLYKATEDTDGNIVDQDTREILDVFFEEINSVIDENNKSLIDRINVYKSTLSKFQTETYDTVSNNNDKLVSALQTLMSGGALNSNDIEELIALDSGLVGQFTKTADGYVISLNKLIDTRESYLQDTKDNIAEEIQSNKDYIKEMKSQRELLWRSISYPPSPEAQTELTNIDRNIKSAESAISLWEQYLTLIENSYSEADTILTNFDNVLSEVNTIRSSLSSLIDGEVPDISFFKDYPELYKYATDTKKLREELEKTAKVKAAPIIAQLSHLISISNSENDKANYRAMVKMLHDISDISKEIEIKNSISGIEAVIKNLENEKELQNDILDSLNKQKEAYEKIVSNYETAASTVTSAIDDEISALEEQKQAIEDKYNNEINALQKENEERDRNIELREKELALEKAKNTKVRVYSASRGWIIQTDSNAVSQAQNEYDDTVNNIRIAELEEQRDKETAIYDERIQEYEDYKKLWEDAVNAYQKAQDEINAATILGSNWRERILNKDTSILETFTSNYGHYQNQLHNVIEPQIEDVQNTISAYETQIQVQNDLKSEQEEYLEHYEAYSERVVNATTAQINAYKELSDTISNTDFGSSIQVGAEGVVALAVGDNDNYAGSFANGGIVDKTGKADVHGTKTNPEIMLNANQAVKMWKWLQTSDTMVDGVLQAEKVLDKLNRFMNSAPKTFANMQMSHGAGFDGMPNFIKQIEPKSTVNQNCGNTSNTNVWNFPNAQFDSKDGYDVFKGYMDRYVREVQMDLIIGKK